MAAVFTIDPVLGSSDVTQDESFYTGTITLSGSYGGGATHGDTLSFANVKGLQSLRVPLKVSIYEQPPAGTAPSYYAAVFCPGTTQANGVVNFSLAGTEYPEGTTYTGVLSTAVWKCRCWFPLGQ